MFQREDEANKCAVGRYYTVYFYFFRVSNNIFFIFSQKHAFIQIEDLRAPLLIASYISLLKTPVHSVNLIVVPDFTMEVWGDTFKSMVTSFVTTSTMDCQKPVVCTLTGFHILCSKRYNAATETINLFDNFFTIHRILFVCDRLDVDIPKNDFIWLIGDFFNLDDRLLECKSLHYKTPFKPTSIAWHLVGRFSYSEFDLDARIRTKSGIKDSRIIYYDQHKHMPWYINRCHSVDYIEKRNVVDFHKPQKKVKTKLCTSLAQTFSSPFFRGPKIRKVLVFYFGACSARKTLLEIVSNRWNIIGIPFNGVLHKIRNLAGFGNTIVLINGLYVNKIPDIHTYGITDVFLLGVVHDFQILSNIINSLFVSPSCPRVWRFLPSQFKHEEELITPDLGIEWSLEKEYQFFKSFRIV